ncbi:methylated-DNA--[protein]-cysteine S-methyltransferase [Sphingomonas donggukensis]|uniref:Methylated-DNA--[protein]-cysteine S-methyltransferase n=1 Tax=Sphingomonas donggukensis TaxID=2949093 RepID=A0ABY4TS83_9SPHN|nr:methylated-DNA--[protein]-cysteine S-methyltransferase [Sphingomonas donggukensis]URW75278.1 methylated-DNA--[protein]-cysteine S-methyltransferase [Sphingomonas donggukensis]
MTYARDTALLATPVGMVRIEGDAATIHRIAIETERQAPRRPDGAAVLAAAEQLEAWFDGALRDFDLALAPARTPRGQALRDGLIKVGYGTSMTYGALARQLGSSARAIGQLCARNPFPIVVPCHRILTSAGRDNYSAGAGVETKRWLIDHETRFGEHR